MVTKAEEWTLEKDLCRCCHAEGTFDNLANPQSFMNQEEIYSDMIKYCFDIEISPVPGSMCAATYTICPNCVLKIRDATSFKRQVQLCEKKFFDLWHKKAISESVQLTQIKDEPEIFYPSDEFPVDDGETDMEGNDGSPAADEYSDSFFDHKESLEDEQEDKSEEDIKPNTKKKKPKEKPKTKSKKQKEEKPKASSKETKEFPFEGWRAVKFTRKNINGEIVWQCVDCERTFKKRDHFSQHYKFVHLKMRPKLRSCHLCNEKVPTQCRPFHMEKAHGLPAPCCGACGKKFAFRNQVLRHQKAFHMGEKQFACAICDMKFASNSLLLSHSMKHSALRPYKCDYCEKSFRWKKNLKTHVHMHLDVRNHVCRVCNESFVQQSSLKYHMSKKHIEVL